MKTSIVALFVAATLFSCEMKDKAQLQLKVDSLSYALNESKKNEATINEIGGMLDSIDVTRHALRVHIVEGITYADYIDRLMEINTAIKESQARIETLESSLKTTKGVSAASIRRLRNDLEAKTDELTKLQLEVATLREMNKNLSSDLGRRDSIISSRDEIIKLKAADVASLEGLIKDINDQNRIKVAGLYFAQAQALELAASRTKFAPRKKKETRREALELYKLSFSMGNTEAETHIQKLEKILS